MTSRRNSLSRGEKNYEALLTHSRDGQDIKFKPFAFIRYVLEQQFPQSVEEDRESYKQRIMNEENNLSQCLGYYNTHDLQSQPTSITQNFIREHFNMDATHFSSEMCQKLAYLTKTTPAFWDKKEFPVSAVIGLRFDFTLNATDIAQPHVGSHQARLKRERRAREFDGLGLA